MTGRLRDLTVGHALLPGTDIGPVRNGDPCKRISATSGSPRKGVPNWFPAASVWSARLTEGLFPVPRRRSSTSVTVRPTTARNLRPGRIRHQGRRREGSGRCRQRHDFRPCARPRHHLAENGDNVQETEPGRNGDGKRAHGGCRPSRAVRQAKGFVLGGRAGRANTPATSTR